MKRYILIFSTLFVGLALTSCLDENPEGLVLEDEAYTSASEIERDLVGDLYNYIGGIDPSTGLQGTIRGVYDWNTVTTDEMIIPVRGADWDDGGFWNRLYNHKWTAADGELESTWNYLYKVIALCNRSLYFIEKKSNLLTTPQYLQYKAEVRGLRAMFYFYTMDMFGRIPLVTDYETKIEDVKQSERSEVFWFIVDELQSIEFILPEERSNTLGNYYGRFTMPVARFLLAKLALNAEIYCDDDWTDEVEQDGEKIIFDVNGEKVNAWDACLMYCDKLNEVQTDYKLELQYEDNFIVHNEYSAENIFTIPMDNTLYSNRFMYLFRSIHYAHGSALGKSGENGPCATISTMRAYGIQDDNPAKRNYSDIDYRFDVNFYSDTVYANGDYVNDGFGNPLVYHPLEVAEDLTGTPYERNGGARMAKYEVDRTSYDDGKLQNNDIVLFRYADVLLMTAEAHVRKGESGQEEFNKVRNRSYASHREATLDNILTERLLELMWEGWRRNDLIRFGRFTEQYDNRVNAVVDNTGYTTVFPIPADVLKLNSKLRQNPGY